MTTKEFNFAFGKVTVYGSTFESCNEEHLNVHVEAENGTLLRSTDTSECYVALEKRCEEEFGKLCNLLENASKELSFEELRASLNESFFEAPFDLEEFLAED